MGGRITLESAQGAGSTFTVSVTFATAADHTPAFEAPDLAGRSVMLVSPQTHRSLADRAPARRMGRADLRDLRLRRRPGAAAGTLVAWRDRRPRNRRRTSRQLGEAARQHTSRAIVMIAPADRGTTGCAETAGYVDYLVKPLRPASLAARLKSAMPSHSIVPDEAVGPRPCAAGESAGEQSLSVLVAEDNEINALLTRSLLLRLGHRPVVATNGAMAVESWIAAESAGTPYDVVLMDVQMPEIDGIEATRRIRMREAGRCGRRTPVLALTANTLVEDRYACFEAGMDGYLIKPLDRERLGEALASSASRRSPPDPRHHPNAGLSHFRRMRHDHLILARTREPIRHAAARTSMPNRIGRSYRFA